MHSKFGIGVLFSIVCGLLSAGLAWAETCGTEHLETLPSCVDTNLIKSPMASGSFVQWYDMTNECGREVEVLLQFSDGQELFLSLSSGQKNGASLPEGLELTAFHCCSEHLSCSDFDSN